MKKIILFFLANLFWFLNIPIALIIFLAIFLPLFDFDGSRYFLLICHHIPSRSPNIDETSIWLCFRCLALYSSFVIGGVTWKVSGNGKNISWRSVTFALILSFPLVIDGVTQYLGWRLSNNVLRVSTGSIMGFPWGFLVNKRLSWEISQISKGE